ncbi:MAG: hypothetical protein IJ841_04080 [Prevotella sp.]|nr:hypothetical protein [Prevotella sp.]
MKKIYFILLALACGTLTACMDSDWDDTYLSSKETNGNQSIKATNLISIADLKTKYKTEINTEGKYYRFTEDTQIKGYVTGNDIQGNMYNEISLQDETGAIFIGIAQGGVYGYLPIGTEIIVELKDLCIGNYRKSATIGIPYTDKDGDVSVSRMSRHLWQNHFTYTGNKKVLEPELFADGSQRTSWSLDTDAGKLGILKNVTIKKGGYYDSQTKSYVDGVDFTAESTYAVPDYSTSWYFNEQPDGQTGGVQIYNSSYADFAANLLPHYKVNIVGVFKRYRDQWEIIIRSIDDVQPAE